MNRPTPTPEQQIDRTLHALAQAKPSPSLQSRLLTALEVHAEQPPVRNHTRLRRFLPISPATALTAAALATVLALLPHFTHTATLPTSHLTAEHQPPTPTQPSKSGNSQLATQPDLSAKARHAMLETSSAVAQQNSAQALRVAATLTITNSADQQALDDLHAPSQPAPPLPPTRQERLVRLMLRRGEKHDLAQLDPFRIDASALEEGASFRAFFDPPRPVSSPLDPEASVRPVQQAPASSTEVQPRQEQQPVSPISGDPQ